MAYLEIKTFDSAVGSSIQTKTLNVIISGTRTKHRTKRLILKCPIELQSKPMPIASSLDFQLEFVNTLLLFAVSSTTGNRIGFVLRAWGPAISKMAQGHVNCNSGPARAHTPQWDPVYTPGVRRVAHWIQKGWKISILRYCPKDSKIKKNKKFYISSKLSLYGPGRFGRVRRTHVRGSFNLNTMI